jgi:cytoskeletal protein RodZ
VTRAYRYPPDEFDVRHADDAPVGVHRAPRSHWSGVWPFLLVAAVAVVIAVAAVAFYARDQQPPVDIADPGATNTQTAVPATTPPVATTTAKPPTATTPAPPPPPTTTAPPTIASLLAKANLAANVRVLNNSGVAGEAARGATALSAKGFTAAKSENFAGGGAPTANSVWYTAGNAATAQAVAAVLGIPAERVTQETINSGDVVVVIMSKLTLPAS